MARKPCSHSPWRKKEITQTLCTMGKEATNELTSYLRLTARVVESLKKKNDADAAKNSHVKEDYRYLLPNSLHRTWMGAGLMQIIMFEYALPARPTKKNWEWRRKSRWWVEVLSRERSGKSSKQTSRLQPETGQSKATNLETQEQTKRIEIYYSQITNYDLLNWFK